MKSEFLLAAVTVLLIGTSSYSQDVIRGTEKAAKDTAHATEQAVEKTAKKRKKWLMQPSPEPRRQQKLLPTPPEKPLTRLCQLQRKLVTIR